MFLFFQNMVSLSFSKRDSLQQTQTEHCPAKHTVKIRSLNRNFSKLSSAKVKFNAVRFKKIANSIIPQPGASYHINPLVPWPVVDISQTITPSKCSRTPFTLGIEEKFLYHSRLAVCFGVRHQKFFSAPKKGNTVWETQQDLFLSLKAILSINTI